MKLCLLAVLALTLFAPKFAAPVDGEYERALAEVMQAWDGWYRAQGSAAEPLEKSYKPGASADKRVLVWAPRGTSSASLLRVSKKVVKAFDKLFPPASRADSAPPRRTAMLFPLAGPISFASITAEAAKSDPALASWAQSAARGVGFLLEKPLAAGWLLKVPDSEVWNPENELVNRLARLLTIERFGRQPHWLAQGLAWHLELKVCKDVYCFPYRSGFVSKREHKAWAKRLPIVMAARGEKPLTAGDLHGWTRNSWHADSAALASGAVDMLAKHYSLELPRVLRALALTREQQGRETKADGSWTLLPNYEISAEQEQEILNSELGVDFLLEFDRYARAPKRYRRPR